MRYEYSRTVPVKTTTAASELASKHQSSKRVRKRRNADQDKQRNTSTRNISEDDSSTASEVDEGEIQNEDHYVHRSSHRQNKPEHGHMVKTSRNGNEQEDTRPGAKRGKHMPVRRNTLQTHAKPQISVVDAEKTTFSPTRPRHLKSSASLNPPIRPSLQATTSTRRTKSEVSSARSSNEKKTSSMFGTFFSSKPPCPPEPKVSCLTCGDDVVKSRTAKLPCTHRMCQTCLKRIFRLSITDPAHMPPTCCTDQHIDLQHVDKLFDNDFKKMWNKKFKEYKAKNRIYCPKTGCGQWIQPKHITNEKGRKTGKCPACKMLVCGICNQKMHKSRDCPKDPLTKQFTEIAKESGWQKCYNCSAMVELKEGCNHMTCRCTAEFCMVCGLKWKSCDCPWFNYDRVDLNGDPIRYQQELDRRREQEHRDEQIARRLEALDLNGAFAATWGFPTLRRNNNARDDSDDNDDDDDDDEANANESSNTRFAGGWGFWGTFNRNNSRSDRIAANNVTAARAAANFFEQGSDSLTGDHREADYATEGLPDGLLPARAQVVEMPPAVPELNEDHEALTHRRRPRRLAAQDPAEATVATTAGAVPVVRRQIRRRRQVTNTLDNPESRIQADAQRDQERRMRRWADDDPAD